MLGVRIVDTDLQRRKPAFEIGGTLLGALFGAEFRFDTTIDDQRVAACGKVRNHLLPGWKERSVFDSRLNYVRKYGESENAIKLRIGLRTAP